MNTGWRAASDSRRPHKSQELRKSGGKSTISKRRRDSPSRTPTPPCASAASSRRASPTSSSAGRTTPNAAGASSSKAADTRPRPIPGFHSERPRGAVLAYQTPGKVSLLIQESPKPPQNGSHAQARTTKCPTGTERRHRHDHQETPPHSTPATTHVKTSRSSGASSRSTTPAHSAAKTTWPRPTSRQTPTTSTS